MPAFDLIDCDWDGGIEQEVDVERVGHGSIDAAGTAEGLDQFGFVDLEAHGLDVWVGVVVAIGCDAGSVAQADAALDLVEPAEAIAAVVS